MQAVLNSLGGGEGVGHGRHAMRGRNDCTVTRVWRRCCVAAQPPCLGELPVECDGESSSLITSGVFSAPAVAGLYF